MIKPNRESLEAAAVLTLFVLGLLAVVWLLTLFFRHVAPPKQETSFRKGFTQDERDFMKAMAIEKCIEMPNCHMHPGDLEWLINYDTFKGEDP
jgi:hypothetical protein